MTTSIKLSVGVLSWWLAAGATYCTAQSQVTSIPPAPKAAFTSDGFGKYSSPFGVVLADSSQGNVRTDPQQIDFPRLPAAPPKKDDPVPPKVSPTPTVPPKKDVPAPPKVSPTPPTPPAINDAMANELSQGSPSLGERALLPGYIDSAIPQSLLRLRFDSMRDSNRPDRAEFFYPRYVSGTIKSPSTNRVVTTIPGTGLGLPFPATSNTSTITPGTRNPVRGRGPGQDVDVPPGSVDFLNTTAYLEIAALNRLSVFGSAPHNEASIHYSPALDLTQTFSGLGDATVGFKFALIATESTYLTFQYTYYIPTGDGIRGLGTEHNSVEPALLLTTRLTDKLTAYGEVREWRAIGGEPNFAGIVRRYGVGAGYQLIETGSFRASPILELVCWQIRKGQETHFEDGNTFDAAGTTILNLKYGIQFDFAGSNDPVGWLGRSALYLGYGQSLTPDRWYKDVVRIEYRIRF